MAQPSLAQQVDDELIYRCRQRDRCAFDELVGRYQQRIVAFIYARVDDLEIAHDLSQETFLRAWSALSRGTNVIVFAPWLFQIARNLVSSWRDTYSRTIHAEPLDEYQERIATDTSVEHSVITHCQADFLRAQLDEVLIEATATRDDQLAGLLRKLAFLAYYVDGLTMREIHADMTIHARALGVFPPTVTQLNNWLCRGDILQRLLRHLIDEHSAWIYEVIQGCLDELPLSEKDRTIASWRWQKGWAIDLIAERGGDSMREVSQTLQHIAREIEQALTKQLKAELHLTRTQEHS